MTDVSRRINIYNFLSDLAHDLLLEIYGTYEKFINTKTIHPLEEYIIKFDEDMEDDGIIIQLGERIGFGLDYDKTDAYTPPEQFYDRCSYTIRNNDVVNINKIMNMTEEEFKTHIEELGLKYNTYMFYDRLNIDSHKYDKELIEMYLNLESAENPSPTEQLSLFTDDIVSKDATIRNPDLEELMTRKQARLNEYKGEDEVLDTQEIRDKIVDDGPNEEETELLTIDKDDDSIDKELLQEEDRDNQEE